MWGWPHPCPRAFDKSRGGALGASGVEEGPWGTSASRQVPSRETSGPCPAEAEPTAQQPPGQGSEGQDPPGHNEGPAQDSDLAACQWWCFCSLRGPCHSLQGQNRGQKPGHAEGRGRAEQRARARVSRFSGDVQGGEPTDKREKRQREEVGLVRKGEIPEAWRAGRRGRLPLPPLSGCSPPLPLSLPSSWYGGSKSVLQRGEQSWILSEGEGLRPEAVEWGILEGGSGRWEGATTTSNTSWSFGGKCMPSREHTEPGNPPPPPQDLKPQVRQGHWVSRADTGRGVQIHGHLPPKTDSSHGGGRVAVATLLPWLRPHSLCKSSLGTYSTGQTQTLRGIGPSGVRTPREYKRARVQTPRAGAGEAAQRGTPGVGGGACRLL